jgi:hypothetical protein
MASHSLAEVIMQIAQIREFLMQHQYDSKLVLVAQSIGTVFRIAVIYPAILAACMVAIVCMQGRGFAEVPYMMLSTMEAAQRLTGKQEPISGQVLIERCADKPIAPSRLPNHPLVCGTHTVESISIDLLASQQGALIKATYLMVVGTFAIFQVYRSISRFRRRA